jgi:hypothetical protein
MTDIEAVSFSRIGLVESLGGAKLVV